MFKVFVRNWWRNAGWFEGGTAPYPVYSVKTGEVVNP